MKVLIIAGGAPPSKELLEKEQKSCDLLIAADSGANCLYEYGILPDLLIGDFDSIDEKSLHYFMGQHCIIEKYPKEKDETDTELALLKAIEKKATEIIFLGCTGSRIDHILGNLGLLKKCLEQDITAWIKDTYNAVQLINKPIILQGEIGQLFSLQAYGEKVEALTIEGAKYPLENYSLSFGDPLTLSNEFLSKEVKIHFRQGTLMILLSRD